MYSRPNAVLLENIDSDADNHNAGWLVVGDLAQHGAQLPGPPLGDAPVRLALPGVTRSPE
jgi:hypothetical protein